MIAGLHVRHLIANRLDDAGSLVPKDGGCGHGVEPIDEVEVAVADAAGDGAHEDLARHRLIDLHFLDRERLVRRVEDCGFHDVAPAAAVSPHPGIA